MIVWFYTILYLDNGDLMLGFHGIKFHVVGLRLRDSVGIVPCGGIIRHWSFSLQRNYDVPQEGYETFLLLITSFASTCVCALPSPNQLQIVVRGKKGSAVMRIVVEPTNLESVAQRCSQSEDMPIGSLPLQYPVEDISGTQNS
ncbi:hypothetical protein KIN20_033042, partial [Parelaphostrongylus tenuis]